MKAIITRQYQQNDITTIVLKDKDGFQIEISQGHNGFVIHSSQMIEFRRYDNLSWEVFRKVTDVTL